MNRLACVIVIASVAAAHIVVPAVRGSADRVERDALETGHASRRVPAPGPLRVSASNPRYFSDPAGRVVYLTGSHTWTSLQDVGVVGSGPSNTLDYERYLDFLRARNHNFIRMWSFQGFSAGTHWVTAPQYYEPLPYVRVGADSKFDLDRFDERYFDRLRSRVSAAGDRGLYVSVMLFQGWSVESRAAWRGHPFNVDNNVNGVDGDRDENGTGEEIFTLEHPDITARQQAYVRKVVDTVNDLDNVLYEVGNEIGPYSTDWQYHIAEYLAQYQAQQPKQHPLGMTFQVPGQGKPGDDAPLFRSPAQWISPGRAPEPYDWVTDPPPADGSKVVLSDTDHFDPASRVPAWVWKTFFRGHNPILMDDPRNSDPVREATRVAMGYTLKLAERIDLKSMVPRDDLASSKYCLADDGVAYLVYLPSDPGGARSERLYARLIAWLGLTVAVDLRAARGPLAVEWFDPNTGAAIAAGTTEGGGSRTFRAPFWGDAVLYISRRDTAS